MILKMISAQTHWKFHAASRCQSAPNEGLDGAVEGGPGVGCPDEDDVELNDCTIMWETKIAS